MLVDTDSNLITQRTHAHLSQIKISLTQSAIIASHDQMPDLEIPLILGGSTDLTVTVWDDQVDAVNAGDEINSWFTKVLNEPCRLAFMPESSSRPVNPERAINGENVSFADAYPYLIISEASLEDLNTRMEVDLPMNRFRPNIVIKGCEAYAEDNWKDIMIGNVKFHVTHPCKRCVFTTIDQETGKKGSEPLKTLAKYRREGNEVIFGVNTLALGTGAIHLGDSLTNS